MAELADAIDLGSIGNTVQVQVLSPAPYLCNEIDIVPEKLAFASFSRFESKNFRCKTVDAFHRFSPKKEVEPYTTKKSNITADFERIPL